MDQRMEEKDGSKNGGEGVTNRLRIMDWKDG